MVMKLDTVVPFGRSLGEYKAMFNLTELDLKKRILGVADGPASFNAETTAIGGQITSIDPLYQFSGTEILQRFDAVLDNIIHQVKSSPEDWVWTYHKSPEDLRNKRVEVIYRFVEDYENGKLQGRYQVGELPKLDIKDDAYELVLCSHFLFLYSDHYNVQFHLESIKEMLRVAKEVRIFPLLTLMLNRSPHLDQVMRSLHEMNYDVSIQPTSYELQKGGNEMLLVRR
jgi:hypothetical protein